MNDWDWFHQARDVFWMRGDQERLRLSDYDAQAFALRETDPVQAEQEYRVAVLLARQLDEPWFEFLYELRRVQMALYFQRNYTRALDLAVPCSLLPRKPEFAHHPKRYYAWIYLLDTYLFIDPRGHADDIERTLAELDRDIPAGVCTNRYLLLESAFSYAMARRAQDEAAVLCQRHLALAADDEDRHRAAWHGSCAHISLCWINHHLQRWEEIGTNARAGEDMARAAKQLRMSAESQLWQGVQARHGGDEKGAQRFLRHALNRLAAIQSPAWDTIYDAHVAFHEIGGELERALEVREQQLQVIVGRGQLASECEIQIDRCRLLRLLDRLTPVDLEAARTAAARLRKPDWYLEQLSKTAI